LYYPLIQLLHITRRRRKQIFARATRVGRAARRAPPTPARRSALRSAAAGPVWARRPHRAAAQGHKPLGAHKLGFAARCAILYPIAPQQTMQHQVSKRIRCADGNRWVLPLSLSGALSEKNATRFNLQEAILASQICRIDLVITQSLTHSRYFSTA
jgi:hypothetical protein